MTPTYRFSPAPAALPHYAQSTPGEFGRRCLFDGQAGIDEVAATRPPARAASPPPFASLAAQPGGSVEDPRSC